MKKTQMGQVIRKKKNHRAVFVFMLCIVMVLLLLWANSIRPTIKTLAVSRAESVVTHVINDAVTSVLSDQNYSYQDLVDITYDADGLVTSICINSMRANELQSRISLAVSEKMDELDRKQISIPLGNLTGMDFLAGRGPRLRLYINLSGTSQAELESEFTQAGINQVLHSLDLNVTANVYIIMTGQNTSTSVSTKINIAQTVIIGKIPEIYAGADDSLWPNLID